MVLYAGPVQVLYERGFLRYFSYKNDEILRMIYFALRDENWQTCDHVIVHEEKDISWETFRIKYRSVSRKEGTDLIEWECVIEGTPDGKIAFAITGNVLQSHKKNRAGLCILHPLDGIVGQTVRITNTHGEVIDSQFPTRIAPENPFKNIRKLVWSAHQKEFELSFEGDIFETEDQRNWTDASFKTFCTPANLPIPVELHTGDTIFQRVSFQPIHKLAPVTAHDDVIIQLTKTDEFTKLPSIGVVLNAEALLTRTMENALSRLNLDHLSIVVEPASADWVRKFSDDCEKIYAIQCPIEVMLMLSENFRNELDEFVSIVKLNRLKVNTVTVLSADKPVTSPELLKFISTAKTSLTNIKWGAGTISDFKEINKNRIDASMLDYVSCAANPQVHAKDDRTLFENLRGIKECGQEGFKIYGKSIHISPATLRPNSSLEPDPRQKETTAALWAFGCIRAAAEAGIESLTLFESHGGKGLLSEDGTLYPSYAIFEKLLVFKKHQVAVLSNSEPLLVDALLFTNDASTTLIIANYTDDLQRVRFGRNEFQILPQQLFEANLSSA